MALTKEHYEELLSIKDGADILGYYNAGLLRDVEREKPHLVTITKVMGEYGVRDKLPYFGAIATIDGIAYATRKLMKLEREAAPCKIGTYKHY